MIALVTGGNRGLGRETVLQLAEAGTDIILTYRTHADEADAVADKVRSLGRKVRVLRLDVAEIAGFASFTDRVRDELRAEWDRDTFDFLVNNAGSGGLTPFTDVTEGYFDELLNVHFKGVFFLTQHLLPLLADGGRIVNVSTALTRFTNPGMSAYASMKAAVEALTRYLAAELAPRGITVNVVAPGATATDFAGGFAGSPEGRAALGNITALGRAGEAGDIGGVVAALLAPGTGWITGQRVEASGGMML
ncbi:SDR family oxidoreductase [Streptomyces sp. J2-1]|uniref:SDR family NAD(P)-dependent oxidoreductase n=1 Tax=Streptomyces corallincola TaxID=2851888 RepID=UPI001C38945A|nr:SDR family oxidoreductase [Streptomyces corallincola]MBV2353967.1 SDR family oxidoreductase [Streptomyces corallincola]